MCTPSGIGEVLVKKGVEYYSEVCSDDEDMNLVNPTVSITYDVRVVKKDTGEIVPPGGSVPKDTVLEYEFTPHISSHIYWFATGNFYDSPYGDWVINAGHPGGNLCIDKNLVQTNVGKDGEDLWASLAVDPPAKAVTVPNASCTDISTTGKVAKRCTLSSAGTVNASFRFENTIGHFYIVGGRDAFKNCARTVLPAAYSPTPITKEKTKTLEGTYTLDVPVQTIPYPITVTDLQQGGSGGTGGRPPSAPVLNNGQCVVGVPHTISMSSVDLDGDGLRYAIDWNNDGSIDQFVPGTGYVPSGIPQSASRTFTTSGTKTIRVAAVDEHGNYSPWTTLQFTCSSPVATAASFASFENVPSVPGGGSQSGSGEGTRATPTLTLRAMPSLVSSGNQSHLFWEAKDVSSCSITGTNGDTLPGVPLQGDAPTSAITSVTTFTLTCRTSGNNTLSTSVTVNVVPSWQEQ